MQILRKVGQTKSRENGYTIFLFLMAVSIAIFLFSLTYLSKDTFQGSLGESLYLFLTVLANPFYIVLLSFPLFYFLYRILPSLVFKLTFFILIGSFFTYLYIDRLVFIQFRFHINSFVLKVLQQEGALQVLGIGKKEISLIVAAVTLCFLITWGIFHLLGKSPLPLRTEKILRGKFRKTGIVLVVFIVFVVDKTIFAWFLYNTKPTVHILAKRTPFYITSQAGRFFKKIGIDPPDKNDVGPSIRFAKKHVKYPLKPYIPSVKANPSRPNIILLMSDALRRDIYNPDVMPNTYEFMNERAVNYSNHFSGSNGTSEGLFSLVYGLPASYMGYFSKAEVSPVLFESLLAHNYQLEISSSKSLGWFGTDQVVFSTVKKYIKDELDPDSIKSDQLVNDYALKAIEEYDPAGDQPLFLMVFYDSPHLPHFHHPDFRKFLPDDTSLIFDPSNEKDRVRGLNEYKNAVNYSDHLFGQLLEKLETKGFLDNSIILFTSDHGSEKYEHGYWGHASAFTNEQLQVPLLLYYPGCQAKTVDRLTSHMDVTVTLLDLIGEAFDAKLHSTGQSLLDPSPREYIIAGGMANRVLIDGRYKIDYTPFEGVSYYTVTDANDRKVPNPDEIIARYTPKILHMFDDFQRFLK
ncbi:MAG: sulfatase-like hydrolase/transferase [Proteobacteria bacterium]|nr:sulfatase-like hydrolase/transferase [Pseudomonadota bacterium]